MSSSTFESSSISLFTVPGNSPQAFLEEVSGPLGLRWLMAESSDGFTWGLFTDGAWHTSESVLRGISPGLTPSLERLTAFSGSDSSGAQLKCWIDGTGRWRAAVLLEGPASDTLPASLIELRPPETAKVVAGRQLLAGTMVQPGSRSDLFTITYERQGLRHAVPLQFEHLDAMHHLQLSVRFFLLSDSDGLWRMRYSRFVRPLVADGRRQ